MADVFISYRRSQRDEVSRIADRLGALGVSVWLDQRLESGLSFDEEINREVRAARAVLVCWSPESMQSKWVRAEAAIGLERDRLVAAFVAPTELYPPYNLIHAANLAEWDGAAGNPEWQTLLARIAKLVERPGLAELARALESTERSALAAWAVRHPQDPEAARFFEGVETRDRETFEARLQEARTRQADLERDRPASFERRLSEVREAFEQWLVESRSRPLDRRGEPPDPRKAVETGEERARLELEAMSRERNAAAALAEREREKVEVLEARLAKRETRQRPPAQPTADAPEAPTGPGIQEPVEASSEVTTSGALWKRALLLLATGPVLLIRTRRYALLAVVYVATPLFLGVLASFVYGIDKGEVLEINYSTSFDSYEYEGGYDYGEWYEDSIRRQYKRISVWMVAYAVLGAHGLLLFWLPWLLPRPRPGAPADPTGNRRKGGKRAILYFYGVTAVCLVAYSYLAAPIRRGKDQTDVWFVVLSLLVLAHVLFTVLSPVLHLGRSVQAPPDSVEP